MPASLRALPCTALLCLALLAGCSDSDASSSPDPGPSTPSSTSASSAAPSEPSASTSSAAPALSPEETVKAWVAARNRAVSGKGADEVLDLSTDACETCLESVKPIIDIYAAGGRFETDGWRIDTARRDPQFARNREVVAALTYDAGRTFADATQDPVSYEAEKHIAVFTLEREAGVWLVAKLVYVS